ncbi:unnamed protein product, partial [Rhizoctonia solani]
LNIKAFARHFRIVSSSLSSLPSPSATTFHHVSTPTLLVPCDSSCLLVFYDVFFGLLVHIGAVIIKTASQTGPLTSIFQASASAGSSPSTIPSFLSLFVNSCSLVVA